MDSWAAAGKVFSVLVMGFGLVHVGVVGAHPMLGPNVQGCGVAKHRAIVNVQVQSSQGLLGHGERLVIRLGDDAKGVNLIHTPGGRQLPVNAATGESFPREVIDRLTVKWGEK
jgi:hypothetical protein